MKKKYIIGAMAGIALIGIITGCATNSGKDISAAGQEESGMEEMTVSDVTSSEGAVQTVSETSETAVENETIAVTSEESENTEMPDIYIEENAESLFGEYDAMFNSEDVNLTPIVGEFLVVDAAQDYQIVENAEGNLYGYSEDYWGGCSVWCAITEWKETAVASSFLPAQGDGSFGAENIISHDRGSTWAEGVEGDGIGEWVSITKSYDNGSDYGEWDCFFFPDLCIVNGMAQNEQAWKEHGSKGELYEDTALTGIEIQVYTRNH